MKILLSYVPGMQIEHSFVPCCVRSMWPVWLWYIFRYLLFQKPIFLNHVFKQQVFLFCLKIVSETFLRSERKQQTIIINILGSSYTRKMPDIHFPFLPHLNFLYIFEKNCPQNKLPRQSVLWKPSCFTHI